MKEFDYTNIGQFINDYKKKPDDFANNMNYLFTKLNEKIKKVEKLKNEELDLFLLELKHEFLDKLTTILSYTTVYKNTKHPHNALLIKIEELLLKNIQMLGFEEFLVYKKNYNNSEFVEELYKSKIKSWLIEFRYNVITMHDIWVND